MTKTALSLLLAGCISSAAADEISRNLILDQLHAQVSVCVAFYNIQHQCSGSDETRRRLAAATRRAEALEGALTMDAAAAALRLELNLAQERSLIRDDCAAVATLRSRYMEQCDAFTTGPE